MIIILSATSHVLCIILPVATSMMIKASNERVSASGKLQKWLKSAGLHEFFGVFGWFCCVFLFVEGSSPYEEMPQL